MLEDALQYPWTGEQKVETLAIGGILSLLGVFFVPMLFVYGYLVRVIRQVSSGDTDTPPAFDDWEELLVDGLVVFGISLVYFLVPSVILVSGLLVWLVPVGVGIGVGGNGGGALAAFGVLASMAFTILGLLTLLAASYLVPAAVAAYARTGQFASAFSPATLQTVGTDESYAVAWLLAVVIGFLAQVVGGALTLTFVGAVLVPFVTFYGNVASAYAIGAGVADTPLVTDTRDSESATGQPAV
ncbi:DUF4013 domain-containing protein [Haloarcula onubensis]|uniref:DUF4013 domain-containing protein n=1 Tax=Haloarcula onubensis TaxID=2950539 RepID=A0ABU2FSG5_9EURY|nr:DUF4013 domain-containing protein [Halomicroarcula sp. S3CR25-11]MDS0283192.1 DUF4013 domain-containing protein [Halomicroarcula sp. S3CR25-11]